MKNFITIALICFSFVGLAQTEKKVEKNDQKIDEVNQRLDNLIGGSKTITGDSVEYKLDLLFNEIQILKLDIQSVRKSIEEIESNGVPTNKNAKLDNLTNKLSDIESGEYYVVIGSERDLNNAKRIKNNLSKKHQVKLVQNAKSTWYHIVLMEAQSMRSAIKTTSVIRNSEVKDAWWVTGRKLKEI